MGTILIALVLLLQGRMSYGAWRQQKINSWCINLPIDMSCENVHSIQFHPISRWGNYILIKMQGPFREEFNQYSRYTELELTNNINHILSDQGFTVSWRLLTEQQLVEIGSFQLTDLKALIFPGTNYITYKAQKYFNSKANFRKYKTYQLEVTVNRPNLDIIQFNPVIQIQTDKSYKYMHPIYPASILALLFGVILIMVGYKNRKLPEEKNNHNK